MKSIKSSQSGFTILELLIATLVFSTVLIIMTYAVIEISRTYIKGYVDSETQNTMRSISDELTQSIQSSDYASPNGIYIPPSGNWFCINGYLYQYTTGLTLTSSSQHVFYVLKPASGGCSSSTNPASYSCTSSDQCKELLGQNMQLYNFSLSEIDTSNQLYQLSFSILYGTNNQGYQANTHNCYSLDQGGEFCSYVSTTTTIQQRVGSQAT